MKSKISALGRVIVSRKFKTASIVVATAAALSACSSTQNEVAEVSLQPAKLFAKLPDSCPTPDALAIAPDGSLTLSCPNYAAAGGKKPGILLRLSEQGEVSTIGVVPGLNGKGGSRPMGLAYAPDGSLFICDNQGKNRGRLLRVTLADGKIAKTEVVAKGMSSPNGVRYHDGALYMTQVRLPKMKGPHMGSGLYRFEEGERNVQVASDGSSPHLIFSDTTKNPGRQFGLDGLAFDKQGNLYTANLGDGTVYKLSLDQNGRVKEKEVYANVPNSTGPDGMIIDDEGNIYLAGLLLNQIIKIDTKRQVSVIAEYPDNDGSNGELDQPVDLMLYNDKLIIANFDLMKGKGIVNKGHGKPYTVSYMELD